MLFSWHIANGMSHLESLKVRRVRLASLAMGVKVRRVVFH